jgi:hypothetical protein
MWKKRLCQLTMAVVVCAPALMADAFHLPGSLNPYAGAPSFNRPYSAKVPGLDGVRPFVAEYEATFHRNESRYSSTTKRSTRSSELQRLDLKGRDAQDFYRAAVYLAIQMIGIDTSTDFGQSQVKAVNNALWSLAYRPSSSYYRFSQHNNGPQYMAQARSSRSHGGFHGFNIWKPKPRGVRDPKVNVPEPSSASMLAFEVLALALLGYCLRRRGVRFVN